MPHTAPPHLQLGLDTFGDVTRDESGALLSGAETIRNVVDQAVLADEVGLSFFGVGEHHRREFAVSSPEIVLAAAAGRTTQIHLGTAVTVLSSDDPVRVYERFATLDAVSRGRAEVILGRGSFIESFPLFGYDLRQYDALFAEKLELLLEIREAGVSREGHGVYPRPVQDPLPVWVAVGGTPESAVRAGMLGLPMALAIIGGQPERFAPFAELHRRAAEEYGHPAPALSINSHGFIADTTEQAIDEAYPAHKIVMDKLGRERGWPPMTRRQFDASTGLRGANLVGSPQEVVEKILFQHEIFAHERFLLQLTVGSVDHARTMRAIELYGNEVAPAVRAELARREPVAAPSA